MKPIDKHPTLNDVPGTPLNAFQITALLALACLNMQDGFDILAISYAANAIEQDWQIGRGNLGIVLSAGLFGMMLGAMVLSPLADKIGRKPIIITGLTLSGAGMVIASFASTIEVLLIGRVITGFGVGAILASLNTLVAEFAGERYRGPAIAVLQLGFPLGAFLSGFIVSWLLDIGNWHNVFAFGAFTSFIFIPVVLVLPESMDYLARSGKPDALERINKIRHRLDLQPLSALPDDKNHQETNAFLAVKSLFAKQYLSRTILIWLAFFFLLTTLYFLLSWIPKLLTDTGFSQLQGIKGGRLINLTGMGGIVLIGVASKWIKPSFITSLYLGILCLLLVLLGSVGASYIISMAIIGVIGFVIHGAMIGLYATTPALYPAHMRTTGMGWAIGLSRFGAVLGPASAGFLLDAGWSTQQLFQFYALPAMAGAVIVGVLWQDEVKRAAQA